MPRKYEKVQKLLPEVQRLNAEGYTHRQIAEKLGQCQAECGSTYGYRRIHIWLVCCIILFSCLGGLFCAVRIFWGGAHLKGGLFHIT